VRLVLKAPTFDAYLAVRRACADAPGDALAEIACRGRPNSPDPTTTIERALDPGTYWVVVEGSNPKEQGPFSLEYRIEP